MRTLSTSIYYAAIGLGILCIIAMCNGCASTPTCDDGYSAQVCEAKSDRGVL